MKIPAVRYGVRRQSAWPDDAVLLRCNGVMTTTVDHDPLSFEILSVMLQPSWRSPNNTVQWFACRLSTTRFFYEFRN